MLTVPEVASDVRQGGTSEKLPIKPPVGVSTTYPAPVGEKHSIRKADTATKPSHHYLNSSWPTRRWRSRSLRAWQLSINDITDYYDDSQSKQRPAYVVNVAFGYRSTAVIVAFTHFPLPRGLPLPVSFDISQPKTFANVAPSRSRPCSIRINVAGPMPISLPTCRNVSSLVTRYFLITAPSFIARIIVDLRNRVK